MRLLPADVVHVRGQVSARGAGTFHDLVDQDRPPVNAEPEESQDGDLVQPEELLEVPPVPMDVGGVAPELPGLARAERPDRDDGEESPAKRARFAEASALAMRRGPGVLDGLRVPATSAQSSAEPEPRPEDIPVPGESDEELKA